MSDRSSGGGPILRKRGQRKRDREEASKREAGPPSAGASKAPSAPAPTARVTHGGAPARRRPAGERRVAGRRRLYDPRAEPADKRASVDGDPARAAVNDIKGSDWKAEGAKPATRRGRSDRRVSTAEKEALKEQAHQLAKDKGVPLVHAYRILKGQTSLNEVLKSMMRKERFDQLVQREGIDRELAGQVASGHLSHKRAKTLTKMRELRGRKLHVDGVSAVAGTKERVALDLFTEGWVIGWVKAARAYDFDLLEDGGDGSTRMVHKHDVKAMCLVDELPAIKTALTRDDVVASQSLAGTEDRQARVRPDDDWMIGLVEGRRMVRCTMRDGEAFLGVLRSFGRWDAELVLPGGETVTVFFHGLHPVSKTLGLTE